MSRGCSSKARGCWTFHRHSVTRSHSRSRLFIAFIPADAAAARCTCVTCAILGLYFRLEPAGAYSQPSSVSNPVTWVPQIAGIAVGGGKAASALDLMPFLHAVSHKIISGQISSELWAPLLLGALVLGLGAAAAGLPVIASAGVARACAPTSCAAAAPAQASLARRALH